VRVLMLINKMHPGGGAERVMAALATHMPRDRFDVRIVTTRSATGPLQDSVTASGIPHLSLDRRARFDLPALRGFVTLLKRERIDVLHSHMFGSNVWGSVLGRLTRVPAVVAHEHSWAYAGQPLRRLIDGQVIGRLADAFVAVSERDRQRMIAVEGVPAHKVVVISNPYIPRADAPAVDVRALLGIPAGAPLVASIAILRPEKAFEVLIEAFSLVVRSVPEARLLLAGDGPCRAMLEGTAAEFGVGDRVHLVGHWEDVGGLLRAVDVAALSSDREGAPLFAIECMVHRTPLVSTDVGNVRDVLADGREVMLVPPRDPAALAARITELLRDPARAAAQAAAAAEHIDEHSIDQAVREVTGLYERLLARRARGRRRPLPERFGSTPLRVGDAGSAAGD
jgi:glycosyltransferase involved in cell wall biosynthesis